MKLHTIRLFSFLSAASLWACSAGTVPVSAYPIRPIEPLTHHVTEGMRVLAPYGEGEFYFVGSVRALGPNGQVQVLFLDGDLGVVTTASLRQENIGPGTLVHARFGADQQWYPGQVQQRQGDRVYVAFDDGDVGWVPLTNVRHPAPPTM